MSSTAGTPRGSDGDPETAADRAVRPAPSVGADAPQASQAPRAPQAPGAPSPSQGWERQPQTSYEAGDSGGWGGPNPGPVTGPIPRIRREPVRDTANETAGRSADEREHDRAPTAGARERRPDSAPSAAGHPGDAQPPVAATPRPTSPPTGPDAATPAAPEAAPSSAPAPPSRPEPVASDAVTPASRPTPSPHAETRSQRGPDTRPDPRREPPTADLPIQAAPTTPTLTRGSFSRYVLPQLLPVTFWLVMAYLVLDGVWTLMLLAGAAPLSALVGPALLVGLKIIALGCLARVVLEACDRAFHR